MAAGCAETCATEAGVRMPRSVLAFQPRKGVKRESEGAARDLRLGERPRLGETLSPASPLPIG
jgi:hypothetical protein